MHNSAVEALGFARAVLGRPDAYGSIISSFVLHTRSLVPRMKKAVPLPGEGTGNVLFQYAKFNSSPWQESLRNAFLECPLPKSRVSVLR